jgi:hypothetical protein
MAISILVPRSVGNSPLSPLIKEWVKSVFQLDESITVMVTELQCTEPGCPPLETVIAIMDRPGMPRQYKLHKAIAEVTLADIEGLREDRFSQSQRQRMTTE